jgi:hypothetical protein
MDAMTPPGMLQAEGQPAGNDMQAQMAQALVAQPKPVSHDVTIITTKKFAQARVLGVPPEEFGIERGARDIKTCNYCFHEVVTKTEGQLIAEGFDEDQVKALGDANSRSESESLSRDSVGENFTASSEVNSAARLVKITEHYIRMDYEGKGRACLYQVITGGDQSEVLERDGKPCITPFDAIPFATTTPVPITHRFFGRSMADMVLEIQRIKTALLRSGLDNRYLAGNPRVEVAESHAGPNTLDDLLVSRPGGVVRTKTPGGLQWQVIPDTAEASFSAMQYLDAVLETRTGIAKQTQGVDANALQNQSATAVAQVFSASQMRIKLIARIMAEGVRDIFSLLHGTIRKHGQQKETVRLRNKWVPVDPRQWKTRADMTINVGLGTGGKAQQFAQMMALANVQKEMIAGGKGHLVGDKELYETAAELTKIMGHKNPDRFFNDPDEKDEQGQPKHPPQPPPEDPAVQVAKVKAQTDQQALQAKSQVDAQADERKAQIEQVQAQADMATEQQKLQGEMALAREKFQMERELKLMDFQLKREMQTAELEMKREAHQQSLEAGVFKVAAGAEAHGQKMEQGEQSHEAKLAAAKTKGKPE